MSKVLGTKVENGLYELFKSLDGTISENLRKAAIEYYNSKVTKPVNHRKPVDTEEKPIRFYNEIISKIDKLIAAHFNDSGRL